MNKIYKKVYNLILEEGKKREYFEGCHKHRIIPGYLGGAYVKDNLAFLTQKEHSIVHFLRWKLFHNLEDKRASKMIGVGPSGLSYEDRKDHGKYCARLKIGFHGADDQLRKEWQEKGRRTQKQNTNERGVKNWYYWSTVQGRRERASMGGKASYSRNEAFLNQQGSFKDKIVASAAAKKSAKKPVTDGLGKMRKFHTEEERLLFLTANPEWRKGCPTKKERLALGK